MADIYIEIFKWVLVATIFCLTIYFLFYTPESQQKKEYKPGDKLSTIGDVLEILKTNLERLPEEKFIYDQYVKETDCGTAACV